MMSTTDNRSNFYRLQRLELPSNGDEIGDRIYEARFFILNGRYFFYDVTHKPLPASQRTLLVFDLLFNKIEQKYTFQSLKDELALQSLSSSDLVFKPLTLKTGLIFNPRFMQKVRLDDESNEVKLDGPEISIFDCQKVYGVQIINDGREKYLLMAYRSRSTGHYMTCLRLFNALDKVTWSMTLSGPDRLAHHFSTIFGTIFTGQFFIMKCRDTGTHAGFELFRKTENAIAMEPVGMTGIEEWNHGSYSYLSGVWRSHTFICSVHWIRDHDAARQSCIYLFNVLTKTWHELYPIFNAMVSLMTEIECKEDDTLIFSSFRTQRNDTQNVYTIQCLDQVYRLPARFPEKLVTLTRFAAINQGYFNQRLKTWDNYRKLNTHLKLIRQKREELSSMETDISHLTQEIMEAENRDPLNFLPPTVKFDLPSYLLQ